ncbi:MAG: hypothetical protein WKF52_10465 [Sphingomicrobium sp.]
MDMRVAAAGTIEPYRRIAVEPEVGRIERLLPGQDQRRRNCARAQLIGNGGELDGFGAGADCKRDLSGQPPLARRAQSAFAAGSAQVLKS